MNKEELDVHIKAHLESVLMGVAQVIRSKGRSPKTCLEWGMGGVFVCGRYYNETKIGMACERYIDDNLSKVLRSKIGPMWDLFCRFDEEETLNRM